MPALHFGPFVVRRQARELWRADQRVVLQRQSFELLLYLMDHAERVVPKEELLTQVWGTVHVSESVLARAVMKLRRALGDDGREPTVVRTVHGVGYRFVAAISHQAAPAPAASPSPAAGPALLGLLPLSNDTGDASLAWAVHGLPALIGHLVSAQGQMQVADAQQVASADQPQWALTERCQHLREMLGLGDVVSSRLHRVSSGMLALSMTVHRAGLTTLQGLVEGPDVAELARRAMQWLSKYPAAIDATQPLSTEVLELLARAANAMQADHYRTAHSLLEQAAKLAPDAVLVHVELADVLRRLGSYREALQHAVLGRSLAERSQDATLQVRARFMQASVAQVMGDLAGARRSLDEGREMAMRLQGTVWPARWALLSGSVAHFQHELPFATQELESAVVLAASSRDLVLQVRARCHLAGVLQSRGMLTQAMTTLERAQKLLARTHSEILEGSVLLALSSIHTERKSFNFAIAQARQAWAVFETTGSAYLACLAAFNHIEALIYAGALNAANAEIDRLDQRFSARGATELPIPQADDFLGFWWEEIAWRRGHHETSLQAQRGLLARLSSCDAFRTNFHELQSRVAAHLLSQGLVDAASEIRRAMDVRDRMAGGRLDAALALARGEPLACIDGLERLWREEEPGNMMSIDTVMDLAWLLMSHPEARPAAVLERLMADVEDYADEYLPAVVVRARFMALQGDVAGAEAALRRGVTQAQDAPVPWLHRSLAACVAKQPWPEPKGLISHSLWD
ncbi:winged helix-turn-helix domain-containing protein [Ideonella paludis]|uniref:Winged helix-turn-helix domain-containing protein n=1 Tax=Ideonella paludis TaxID=1233411 RepID=A0ABS5DTA5_9BURK|nr:winged helix-turn-helix domain-containing protein [Ideonella paludis]MBQ0934373.1 winged helix-turn-helix domain-containing protein [Ideonella paludis]